MPTATSPLEIKLVYALRRIALDYQTSTQILRDAEKEYGLSGPEALEYAYDNLQAEAKQAIKGVRVRKI